ncbi:MAG: hypothetical protein JWQ40_1750 [Segetibacter sp.]|nr:hypothetical protein [Segetibacter sp.]
MKKSSILLLIVPLFYFSCKETKKETGESKPAVNDTTTFFQVSQFVKSQIDEVNKTPYYIYKIDITNDKRDSIPIDVSAFKEISNQFVKPDINDPALKKFYVENIFHDQTTKSFTISYTTTNKELEVQNVEVLLDEDGETVKRVFMRKFFNYSDSTALEQLSWKTNESFMVNRLVQMPDKKEISHQTIVVWNEKS